ncbi:MAG: hypothetical protein AB1560_03570 [Pseudomonadota bacterium]
MRNVATKPARVSPMRCRGAGKQGGFLLIAAVVLIVGAALVLTLMVFLSATGAMSTADHVTSNQALFIAESGLEKGTREFSLNSAYGGETNTSLGNGNFTITTRTTDFSGNTLPSRHLRLQSVGKVSGSGATRTTETIVGPENLLPLSANADFNMPAGACAPPCQPNNWILNADPVGSFTPWQDAGGPETPATRAAYATKPSPGSSTATNAGNFTFSSPIVVTAPATLQMNFDYKVVTSGSTSQEMQLTFTLTDGVTTWTAPRFDSGNTGTYQNGSVAFNITGTGTKSITNLGFSLFLKSGQPKDAWLDNLALTTGSGPAKIETKAWREVFQ